MNNTPNRNTEERKSQPAQATQGSNPADRQMGDSSVNKDKSTTGGQSAGQARPAQPHLQSKFTQQRDVDKSKAAPLVEKGKNESEKKAAKACC